MWCWYHLASSINIVVSELLIKKLKGCFDGQNITNIGLPNHTFPRQRKQQMYKVKFGTRRKILSKCQGPLYIHDAPPSPPVCGCVILRNFRGVGPRSGPKLACLSPQFIEWPDSWVVVLVTHLGTHLCYDGAYSWRGSSGVGCCWRSRHSPLSM